MKKIYSFIFIANSFIAYSQNIDYKINSASIGSMDFVVGVTEVQLTYAIESEENLIPITNPNSDFSNQSGFSYFPNPVEDKLYLYKKNNSSNYEIEVYNELGQFIFKETIKNNYIDLSSLIKGMYLIVPKLEGTKPFKVLKK